MTRVLIADDDPANVELLTTYLAASGFEVSTAMDGNRALELGLSGEFHVAVIDVHMPTYDGIEVLRMLRRRHVLHPMRIIALTGDGTPLTRDALQEIGVDEFMMKPVDLKDLLGKVRSLSAG